LNKSIIVFDRIFLLRPTLFYPIWTFFLAGCWGGRRFGEIISEVEFSSVFYKTIISLTMIMGGVFILNQIQDIETDKANRKLFILANGFVSIKEAYIESFIFIAGGLILGFWIGFQFGLKLLVLFLLSGVLYNFRPAIWKNHPFMGLITNGLGGVIIYSLGWRVCGGVSLLPERAIAYALAGVAVFLNTTLPDINGDKSTGKITFGVRYGIKKTAIGAFIFEIISLGLALFFKDWLLFFPAAAVLPFFIWSIIKPNVKVILRTTKFSVLLLAVAVCFSFPLYIVPIFSVYFFSRWYYKKRFNFDYPSLRSS
jgi:4-hydroxybenzoate polyprenyltransferase